MVSLLAWNISSKCFGKPTGMRCAKGGGRSSAKRFAGVAVAKFYKAARVNVNSCWPCLRDDNREQPL
jgi:hypothetical protein